MVGELTKANYEGMTSQPQYDPNLMFSDKGFIVYSLKVEAHTT